MMRRIVNVIQAEPFSERFFIDRLTITGDVFLIPTSCRHEWHAFDVAAEESGEAWPIPEWARPIEEISHIEFEQPRKVL